jgi:hypothetical protein
MCFWPHRSIEVLEISGIVRLLIDMVLGHRMDAVA